MENSILIGIKVWIDLTQPNSFINSSLFLEKVKTEISCIQGSEIFPFSNNDKEASSLLSYVEFLIKIPSSPAKMVDLCYHHEYECIDHLSRCELLLNTSNILDGAIFVSEDDLSLHTKASFSFNFFEVINFEIREATIFLLQRKKKLSDLSFLQMQAKNVERRIDKDQGNEVVFF